MARWVGFVALVLLFLAPRFAAASLCGSVGDVDVRELEGGSVVFAGRSMEYLERREDCSDDAPDIDAEHRYTGAVFRFVVHQSLDFPEGSEVLVFTGGHRPWFAVGEEHLVVASDRNGMLWADRCPYIGPEKLNELRALLRVPESSLAGVERPWRFSTRGSCTRPRSLDEAMLRAAAVGRTDVLASCALPGDLVEHAARLRVRWKGPEEGAIVRIHQSVDATKGESDFPFAEELADATDFGWPPAEFFHVEGDTYVNDGCDAPLPPQSLEEGVEALTRLMPRQPRNEEASDACTAIPSLSCSTLTQELFAPADARFIEHVRSNMRHAPLHDRAPRSDPPPPPPSRSGSCAGCAVSNGNGASYRGGLLALLLAGRRRRFTRVRSRANLR